MHRFLVLGVLMMIGLAGPGSASAADPQQFLTYEDTCDPAEGPVTAIGDPEPDAHADVIMRYEVGAGSALLDDHPLSAGDVVWGLGTALAADDRAQVDVDCSDAPGPSPVGAYFFARPTAPTTFAGAGNTFGSVLGFVAPTSGPYAADVTVSGGTVNLTPPPGGPPGQDFSAAGTYNLGTLAAGPRNIAVRAAAGPTPTWRVAIRAVTVNLTGLSLDRAVLSRAAPLRATFTVDGDTTVSMSATTSRRRRYTIISERKLGAGTHTLAWDLNESPAGTPVSGDYGLEIKSRDSHGHETTASAPFAIDLQAPRVLGTPPRPLFPEDALSIVTTDRSGPSSLSVIDDPLAPGASLLTNPAPDQFRLRPIAGNWSVGPHAVRVAAVDQFGNRSETTLNFNVVETLGKPCGTDAALEAIVVSARVRKSLGDTPAARGRPLAGVYSVGKVLCRDLNADTIGDMVVLLRTKRPELPTPVLGFLGSRAGVWHGRLITARHRIIKAGFRGKAVILRAPLGAAYKIRHDGRHFRLREL